MSFDVDSGGDKGNASAGERGDGGPGGDRPQRHRFGNDQPIGRFCRASGIHSGSPVVVIVGSAAKITKEQTDTIDSLLRQAVVPVLEEYEVTVVDGGTDAGVMRLLGRAIADSAHRVTLVGVAPADLISVAAPVGEQSQAERHHDHLILTDGSEWTDELEVLGDIAEHLAGSTGPTMMVIGGGSGTEKEVDLARRMGWPIIVVDGTGGVADEIADDGGHNNDLVRIVDVRERAEVRKQLRWRLDPDLLLRRVWLDTSDLDASSTRPMTGGLRTLVLLLGLGIVALALFVGLYGDRLLNRVENALQILLAVLPAGAAALMAWSSRRRRDDRWIAPRAATNAALGEIFRYRAGAEKYGNLKSSGDDGNTPQRLLAARWGAILGRVGDSASATTRPATIPVFAPALSVAHPMDELLGNLSGGQYETVRVNHQLDYFPNRIATDERTTSVVVAFIYGMAVVGTLLASIDGAVAWVAASASAATAAAAWLEYERTEHRSRQMKSTVSMIEASRARWLANSKDVRDAADSVRNFVADCEAVLFDENREWERAVNEASRSFAQHAVP